MSLFIHFKDIDLSQKTSFEGKKILSFDIDWASDEVIQYTLDKVEKAGIKATFFVTHHSPILRVLEQHQLIELGIHPNFNKLFEFDGYKGRFEDIFDELLTYVPNPIVTRSHCLTNSAKWHNYYISKGIKFSSNYMAYGQHQKPYSHVNGLIECPIHFADDGHLLVIENGEIDIPESLLLGKNHNGLSIYDFHPIHIAMNTPNPMSYENTRHLHKDFNKIMTKKCITYGVESIFDKLITLNLV